MSARSWSSVACLLCGCTFPTYTVEFKGDAPIDAPIDTSITDAPSSDTGIGAEVEALDSAVEAAVDAPVDAPIEAGCPTAGCAPVSCLAVLTDNATATDGVYSVDIDGKGPEPPFYVYCDMTTDKGGWMLVYKITAGVATKKDPARLWLDGVPVNEGNTSLLGVQPSTAAYVNRMVGPYWNGTVAGAYGPTTVRVHLYRAGTIGAFFKFNNRGSGNATWFSQANLVGSSFGDLATAKPNYFAIAGDTPSSRFWFINNGYGGCTVDNGWLAVTTGAACPWESGPPAPRILHAKPPSAGTWQSSAVTSDVMAVFVR